MHRNLINGIITEKQEVSMAAGLLQEISRDERERAILRSRRMYETDMMSDLLTAEEKGEIRGLARGLSEGKAEGRIEGLTEGVAKGRIEGKAEGLTEGVSKGRIEGLAEGKAKIIALLKKGFSLEEIEQMI